MYVCMYVRKYVCMHVRMYIYALTSILVTSNSCNMGTRDLPDMYARSPRAYISGKSQVHMLQVICLPAL